MQTFEYRSMYENEVNKQYHELKEVYSEIQVKLEKMSEENPNLYNELEGSFLHEEINFMLNGKEFKTSNFNKKEYIEEALNEYHFLKSEALSELFDVRKRMLDKRNKKLNDENYRTALSIISEFYNDIYIDILKNKLTFITKGQNKSNFIGLEFIEKRKPEGNYEYLFNKNNLKTE